MLKILHISDIHFGPPYRPTVGEALLAQAPSLAPDVVVISGDFTQRAKPEQFQEAKAFLARLPDVPQVVVPGNHDVPLYRVIERWFEPHKYYRQYIHDELNYVVEVPGAVIVALDSTAPHHAITNGRIAPDQLAFCERALKDVPDSVYRIVVAHHQFASAPDYAKDRRVLNARRAMECFAKHRVDMILGGHLHRAYVGNSLDVCPIDGDRGIVIVQSGTSTSRRGRAREKGRNSFNMLTMSAESIRVEHYMHFEDAECFERTGEHTLPRPGLRFAGPAELEH